MEQKETNLTETPQGTKQDSLWEDNKRVIKRNLKALLRVLLWLVKAIVEVVGWIVMTVWEYLSMKSKTIAGAVIEHKMIALGIVAVILLLCNLGQLAYNRATEEDLQYRIDSLELKCDTLRNCSLYDIGYRDGLVHGNQLAVK